MKKLLYLFSIVFITISCSKEETTSSNILPSLLDEQKSDFIISNSDKILIEDALLFLTSNPTYSAIFYNDGFKLKVKFSEERSDSKYEEWTYGVSAAWVEAYIVDQAKRNREVFVVPVLQPDGTYRFNVISYPKK